MKEPGAFYREIWQDVCPYCAAKAGDPCHTRSDDVLPPGREHVSRVQAWQARWLAGYQLPERQPTAEVTVADVAAGMRRRPGFREGS